MTRLFQATQLPVPRDLQCDWLPEVRRSLAFSHGELYLLAQSEAKKGNPCYSVSDVPEVPRATPATKALVGVAAFLCGLAAAALFVGAAVVLIRSGSVPGGRWVGLGALFWFLLVIAGSMKFLTRQFVAHPWAGWLVGGAFALIALGTTVLLWLKFGMSSALSLLFALGLFLCVAYWLMQGAKASPAVRQFYENTRAAWVSGSLDQLTKGFYCPEREAFKSLSTDDLLASEFGPQENRLLDLFLQRFPPRQGEFLAAYEGSLELQKWYVLTSQRLVVKEENFVMLTILELAQAASVDKDKRGVLLKSGKLEYIRNAPLDLVGRLLQR